MINNKNEQDSPSMPQKKSGIQHNHLSLLRKGHGEINPKQIWLGVYLLVMAFMLGFLVFELWPSVDGKQVWPESVKLFGIIFKLNNEARLLLLVMLVGAMGSYVHTATSFVTYVGNRNLVSSWTWWYILRPFIGMALALIFYFVVRGGLLSAETGARQVSPFGIAALAGLVGMFSKQATDKLREIFDNLFKTESDKGDDIRRDKVGEKIPVKEVMIPVNKITHYAMSPNEKEEDIRITKLYELLKGVVTRIPVLNPNGSIKCIIHQSILYKFIAQQSLFKATEDGTFNIESASLADILNHPDMSRIVVDSLAFVSLKATLSEAKLKMDNTKNCQDIFITDNGEKDEPVKGWLTNIDITKHMKV
jgi:hypothetical protein